MGSADYRHKYGYICAYTHTYMLITNIIKEIEAINLRMAMTLARFDGER